jgi:hypothetical protein
MSARVFDECVFSVSISPLSQGVVGLKVQQSVDRLTWTDYVDPPPDKPAVTFEHFYPRDLVAPTKRSGITGKPRWSGLVRR